MINILGKRYWLFGLSLLVIVPGLILGLIQIINGDLLGKLPLAIDFTGGSLLEVQFASGQAPLPADVITVYNELGIKDVQVQTTGVDQILVRSPFMQDAERATIVSDLASRFNDTVTVLRFDSVGPTIGKEVVSRASVAVAVAALVVVVYIWIAFRGLPHALRYGICAIIAMIHDVAIVISLGVIGGKFFGWQIDALYLTALLTVIGFSVQDKVVVFDRIRENSNIYRRLPFESLVNHSIIQTLQRSINTQLMTVEFMLLAMALFGGVTLREFAVILLVGLFSGTYSSIFIAAPILVLWENREWRSWFKRGDAAA